VAWYKHTEYKFLFVHIPKTGGRALSNFFEEHLKLGKWSRGGHIRLIEINPPSDYFTFCVVRNPYTRIQSFYRHFYQEKIKDVHKKTFLEFVKDMPNSFHKKTQTYWVSDNSGKIIVDSIIKYENYESEIPLLLKKLNIVDNKVKIPQYKMSDKSIKAELTDEIKEIIYNKYKEDFDNFGYEK